MNFDVINLISRRDGQIDGLMYSHIHGDLTSIALIKIQANYHPKLHYGCWPEPSSESAANKLSDIRAFKLMDGFVALAESSRICQSDSHP